MELTKHLSKHLKDVNYGGNWTTSNLKDILAGTTWQQATTQVYSLNTIATLVFHINYFVGVATRVLQGGPLVGKDSLSFNHPPIESQQDWEDLLQKTFAEANTFAALIEQLPDSKMWEPFTDSKYGNYYRNIQGIIEHTHYHLGQIAVIKKILVQVTDSTS